MRIEAISSDPSRALTAQAVRTTAPAQPAQKPAATTAPKGPKDADGDTDGDMGRKGALVDIGA
jgi:hypothetical protein